LRNLKHGEAFAVLDSHGDLGALADTAEGLFYRDTRFLSHFELRLQGQRAAAIYTLIQTAKLNDVDPQAWLADILARLQDYPARRIDELLPWSWNRERAQKAAA